MFIHLLLQFRSLFCFTLLFIASSPRIFILMLALKVISCNGSYLCYCTTSNLHITSFAITSCKLVFAILILPYLLSALVVSSSNCRIQKESFLWTSLSQCLQHCFFGSTHLNSEMFKSE